MRDTTPEMEEKMREMIRAKSPIERLRMGASMHSVSRRLVIRAILENQPDISQTALRQELFLKFYGNDVDAVQQEAILTHFATFETDYTENDSRIGPRLRESSRDPVAASGSIFET